MSLIILFLKGASRELKQEPLKQSTNSSEQSGSTEVQLEEKRGLKSFSKFAGRCKVGIRSCCIWTVSEKKEIKYEPLQNTGKETV